MAVMVPPSAVESIKPASVTCGSGVVSGGRAADHAVHGGFRSHTMADLCMHSCDCHETTAKKPTRRQQASLRSVWLR